MENFNLINLDEKAIIERLDCGSCERILGGANPNDQDTDGDLDSCIVSCSCPQMACGLTCQA